MSTKTTFENNICPLPSHDQILSLVDESCGKLPGELVVEILCKLPVKSLIRFQTVCKPWKLLTNSPVFIDKHLHRKKPQFGVYSVNCRQPYPFIEDTNSYVGIVGACNGIICFQTGNYDKPLLLLNPSTGEFSFIPTSQCHQGGFHGFFALPRFYKGCFLGFCYLSKTQEYLIISFRELRSDENLDKMDIQILTLGDNKSLRHVKNKVVPGRIRWENDNKMVTTYGTKMFWLGVEGEIAENSSIVICYDVIEERFSRINVPPYPTYVWFRRTLTVFKDSFCMFVCPTFKATSFDIFRLVDHGSNGRSWMKDRKIGPFETGVIMNPIDVLHDSWILCYKHERRNGLRNDEFCYYDLETNQVEDHKGIYAPTYGIVSYVESLVSVHRLAPFMASKEKALNQMEGGCLTT